MRHPNTPDSQASLAVHDVIARHHDGMIAAAPQAERNRRGEERAREGRKNILRPPQRPPPHHSFTQ
jgi:hypothetical protein